MLAALGAAELARWGGKFVAWVVYGPQPRVDVPVAAGAVAARDAPPDLDGDSEGDRDGAREVDDDDGEQADEDADEPVPERAEDPRHVFTRLLVIGIIAAVFTVVALVRVNATRGYIDYWAKYNYSGYEGGTATEVTKKDYAGYKAFIDTARTLPP